MQPFSPASHSTETEPSFYTWKGFRCAYEFQPANSASEDGLSLLLIHPIGVGLSRRFWDRFCQAWHDRSQPYSIYNPDLLGCGVSDLPHVAYSPIDWAQQLKHFLETVVQSPTIIIVQGALLPVAITLVNQQQQPNLIRGLVLAGPPAWEVLNQERSSLRQRIAWNLFDSPVGNIFYRYARRRQFLKSFSERELFADPQAVDSEWLDTLKKGSANDDSRHAVFSFLSGFWRQNYEAEIAKISQPTLVVVGNQASSISSTDSPDIPEKRISQYTNHLPNAEGCQIKGRNVLPYESTDEFVSVVANFVNHIKR